MTREELEKKHKLCELLANLDGCEGGEFLMNLFDLYENAWGGGYAYSGDEAEAKLLEIVDAEIAAHKKMIYADNASDFGYDDPEEARRLIEEMENK